MQINKTLSVVGICVAFALGILSGCSVFGDSAASPSPSAAETASISPTASVRPSPTVSLTKDEVAKTLASYGDKAYDITWSPDNTAVAFIKQDDQAANIYVWKLTQAEAQTLYKAEDTTSGFSWSPNSKYFLVNVGHMGPGTITSTLIDADSLKTLTTDISTVSVSPPVWSADSRFLALSLDDEATNAIEVKIYTVAAGTSISAVKSVNKFGPYIVTSWGEDNNIKYTEATSESERIEKTIGVGE
jgi:hypothetical protein